MVERGEVYLGGDILPIARITRLGTIGEELLAANIASAGVTALNHKVLDDTVEQQRVKVVLLDKLHKVIAVDRRKVAKLQNDVTSRRLHLHAAGLGLLRLPATADHNGCNDKRKKYLFHHFSPFRDSNHFLASLQNVE